MLKYLLSTPLGIDLGLELWGYLVILCLDFEEPLNCFTAPNCYGCTKMRGLQGLGGGKDEKSWLNGYRVSVG